METETCARLSALVLRVAVAFLAVAMPWMAQAQSATPGTALPVWEVGLGVQARISTDYPGGRDASASAVPIPYLRYRGRLFELGGQDALRFIPLQTERFELGFSLDSSQRVTNRVTSLGAALPDLDRLFEFGPELSFLVLEDPAIRRGVLPGRIDLVLASRGVYSFDDRLRHEGTILRPAIRYRVYDVRRPGSRLEASLGWLFATEGVQDVYYEVAPGPQTAGFDARGGYMGAELRAGMRYPLSDRIQLVGGGAVSWLGGAVNADSPAMRADWDATAFLRITYALFQSRNMTLRDR